MCELFVLNRAFLMRFSTKSPHILVCMGNNGNGQCPILFAFSAKRPCFLGQRDRYVGSKLANEGHIYFLSCPRRNCN